MLGQAPDLFDGLALIWLGFTQSRLCYCSAQKMRILAVGHSIKLEAYACDIPACMLASSIMILHELPQLGDTSLQMASAAIEAGVVPGRDDDCPDGDWMANPAQR